MATSRNFQKKISLLFWETCSNLYHSTTRSPLWREWPAQSTPPRLRVECQRMRATSRLLLGAALLLLLACGAEAWGKKKAAPEEVIPPPWPRPCVSAGLRWVCAGRRRRRGCAAGSGGGLPRGRRVAPRACPHALHARPRADPTPRAAPGTQARPAANDPARQSEGPHRLCRADRLHEDRWHQQVGAMRDQVHARLAAPGLQGLVHLRLHD